MNSHKGQVQHLGTAVYFRSHLLVLMLPFPYYQSIAFR